jgi:hypothetical protein
MQNADQIKSATPAPGTGYFERYLSVRVALSTVGVPIEVPVMRLVVNVVNRSQ